MIRYYLSRMWLFHATIPCDASANAKNLRIGGHSIGSVSGADWFGDEAAHGYLEAVRREYAEQEKKGHDVYLAVDLKPDDQLLSWIKKNRLNNEALKNAHKEAGEQVSEPEDVELFGNANAPVEITQFQMRVTDYGFLNVLVGLTVGNKSPSEVADIAALKNLKNEEAFLTRIITGLVKELEPKLFQSPAGPLRYCPTNGSYFGIPTKLRGKIKEDETDTYLYQEHVFLSEESHSLLEECKGVLGVSGPVQEFRDGSEVFEICCLSKTPIWLRKRIPESDESFYLLEPDNLLLAEKCTYDVAHQLYGAASTLVTKDRNTDALSREDLQELSVRFANTVGALKIRPTALHEWQRQYMEIFKDNFKEMEEARHLYEKDEQRLKEVLHEAEVERNMENAKRSQILRGTNKLLGAIASIVAICSAVISVLRFFLGRHSPGWLIVSAILVVLGVVGTCYLYYLFRRPRD